MSVSQSLVDTACKLLGLDRRLLFEIYKFKRALDADDHILNAGREDEISAKDLLWQSEWGNFDHMGSAYLTFLLWIGIVTHPRAISASLRVGGSPYGDKAFRENNEILSRLTPPFSAYFEGGPGGADGHVGTGGVDGLPETVPLEVGSVHPAVLYERAFRSRCFARWPYNSKFIYIFKSPDGISFKELISSHLKECAECIGRSAKRK